VNIKITIEPDINQLYVEIHTPEFTHQVQDMIELLDDIKQNKIIGLKDKKIYILKPDEILCFFSEGQNVYARTETDTFMVKIRLFEIEEFLKGCNFFRISNSSIINIEKISNLELYFNGTMCVHFKNGTDEYASRRYVAKLKKFLGM
jgi:DNA-binding LytR/AlgR family response regulator